LRPSLPKEDFHRQQAKKRSEIRIRDGREKPIDMLAKNLYLMQHDAPADLSVDLEIELSEPTR
jgi:hypothetical protein